MENQLLKQAQQRKHEAKKRENEANQKEREEEFERQTGPTILPEYLDACHVHLFCALQVRDAKTSTRGKPANARKNYRPERIKEWVDFPSEQEKAWNSLMDLSFVSERHFTSLIVLEEQGKELRRNMMGSRIDLGYFVDRAVQDCVELTLKGSLAGDRLRETFNFAGEIGFENHSNTITGETYPNPGEEPVRPRANQFCIYNRGSHTDVPAFVVGSEAPHRVGLDCIEMGLKEMDVSLVEQYKGTKNVKKACSYLIAAVISQTYSYMIQGGFEYGYVCTGEAFIFLHIPSSDPTTVLYYPSIPIVDVGETSGFSGNLKDKDNRLHWTAVGQVLAFTLRSLWSAPRGQAWVQWALSQLKMWDDVDDKPVKNIPEDLVSATKPVKGNRRESTRSSPVKTRSRTRAAARSQCEVLKASTSSGRDGHDEGSGNGFDSETPGRKSRNTMIQEVVVPPSPPPFTQHSGQTSDGKGKSRQYCTNKCILGLVRGGPLDVACPNAKGHGIKYHSITQSEFIKLLQAQLLRGNLGPNSLLGCESLHVHGVRAALFEVTLFAYGYTLVAKGVPPESIPHLKHEENIYDRLSPIQGIHVPVCLGSVGLTPRPVWYDGIARIFRLMVLTHAGTLIRHHVGDFKQLAQPASDALKAIHKLGVLHEDTHINNMFWNAEMGCVMFIDFERARIHEKERLPLGFTSPNRKRKRRHSDLEKESYTVDDGSEFRDELNVMHRNMS